MSWACGLDPKWNRDIGYGVPGNCDQGCGAVIDRGLAHVCGGDVYGGEHGCGLFFCDEHLLAGPHSLACRRCLEGKPPFEPTPDRPSWLRWKLTHGSWEQWRQENPQEVEKILKALAGEAGE